MNRQAEEIPIQIERRLLAGGHQMELLAQHCQQHGALGGVLLVGQAPSNAPTNPISAFAPTAHATNAGTADMPDQTTPVIHNNVGGKAGIKLTPALRDRRGGP